MKNWLIPIITLLYFPAKAQVLFTSFQDLLNYADEHAISVQSAVMNEQIANAGKKEAKSFLFPTVNASAGYNDNITLQPTLVPAQIINTAAPEGTFEEMTFGKPHIYSAGVQAQWDVLNFQKIFASQTAHIQAEESKVNTQKSRFSTYNALASTYYSILLTQESIRIYEENTKASEAIYKNAQEKFQKGIIGEAELNTAAIKNRQNKSNLSQVNDNLKRFYTQLQSQLNMDEDILITDTPQKFALADSYLQNVHPEILWQEMEVKKYQSILKQRKALHLPSLSVVYQYNYNWATDGFLDFSGANHLPQQFLGVKLNVPLFSGFSTHHKINQSKWELQLQQLQLENTKLVKQKEDEMLLLELKQSSQQLSDNQQILELQQQNDVHAENKYQSGIMSLDERLNKYDDLLTAQNNYLQSLATYTLAQYKIYIRKIDFSSNKR
ncbi:MAG: TolC family protein [Pseudosphingobacterium sp.]|nr:TolC family protein [Pseudosphingobacterium sp.]